jgi:molybdate/tungstate transport system substrate-binding protein
MHRRRRPRSHRPYRRPAVTVLTALAGALLLAACGSSSRHVARSAPAHGSVNVLYAGSLEQLMNAGVGPAFQRATGYSFAGFPAGSKELASEIRGKVRQGDVLISAAPAVNATLEGAGHGNWVSWYAPFASTRLVLGYNAHSSFAARLRTEPWYKVISSPGLRIGFTDPKLDPKGVLTLAALHRAAALYHEPALAKIASDGSDYFPEEDLVGRLQAGQLDAGFFYTVEASAARIPIVSLAPIDERATYTITVLNRAPDARGAAAFVRFLLGGKGRALMQAAGLDVSPSPRAIGSGVPAALGSLLRP